MNWVQCILSSVDCSTGGIGVSRMCGTNRIALAHEEEKQASKSSKCGELDRERERNSYMYCIYFNVVCFVSIKHID